MQALVDERLWAAKRGCPGATSMNTSTGPCGGSKASHPLRFPFRWPSWSGCRNLDRTPLAFRVGLRRRCSRSACGVPPSLLRELHWPTAFALRIFRVPVGISCLWWRYPKHPGVRSDAKSGADERMRGRGTPGAVGPDPGFMAAVPCLYAPARPHRGGAVALRPRRPPRPRGSGCCWPALVLVLGTRRIQAPRRTRPRGATRTASPSRPPSRSADVEGELVDISVGGAAVAVPGRHGPHRGPGRAPAAGCGARWRCRSSECRRTPTAATWCPAGCWPTTGRATARCRCWLFHTPAGVVGGMPHRCARGRRHASGGKPPAAVRSFGQSAPVAPATT